MRIQNRAVAKIKPYDNNPRRNSRAVDAVAASIRDFGFRVPIVVDAGGVIVAGHTRYEAAKQLGMASVPCVVAEDLTPDKVKAFRLADNKVAEVATWNEELLYKELEELTGFDMREYGFSSADFEAVTNAESDGFTSDSDTDNNPQVKAGELWLLGDHRLVVGDATKAADVSKLCGKEEAQLLLTDPPYNVDYEGGTELKLTMTNDNMSNTAFIKFLTAAFTLAANHMEAGAAYYIWHADAQRRAVLAATEAARLQMRQVLVWIKQQSVMGRQDYQWRHEPCLYGWKSGSHYFTFDRTQTTVIDDEPNINRMSKDDLKGYIKELRSRETPSTVIREDKPQKSSNHPTMKPVPMIGRLISNSSKRGDIVLDMFAGSGSTLIAAEQLGRKCYAMEIDPRYADVIIHRWEELTGSKARRQKDG